MCVCVCGGEVDKSGNTGRQKVERRKEGNKKEGRKEGKIEKNYGTNGAFRMTSQRGRCSV